MVEDTARGRAGPLDSEDDPGNTPWYRRRQVAENFSSINPASEHFARRYGGKESSPPPEPPALDLLTGPRSLVHLL
jgi:hypothetical protein